MPADKTTTLYLKIEKTRYGSSTYVMDSAHEEEITTTVTNAAGKVLTQEKTTREPSAILELCARAKRHLPIPEHAGIYKLTVTIDTKKVETKAKKAAKR